MSLPMQPTRQRIRACVDKFRLRMDFCGVRPWLWLKAWEIPAQPAPGNQRHSPLCTSCFLLLNGFQIMVTVQVNSLSWEFSCSEKEAFLLCAITAQRQFVLPSLFPRADKGGKDPDKLKRFSTKKKKKRGKKTKQKADFISWVHG